MNLLYSLEDTNRILANLVGDVKLYETVYANEDNLTIKCLNTGQTACILADNFQLDYLIKRAWEIKHKELKNIYLLTSDYIGKTVYYHSKPYVLHSIVSPTKALSVCGKTLSISSLQEPVS